MPEIKITFSDGSTVVLHEEQTFHTWVKSRDSVSLSETYSLWAHHNDGLVPSFLELLMNSEFFFDMEKPEILYNSNSVVKIEVI